MMLAWNLVLGAVLVRSSKYNRTYWWIGYEMVGKERNQDGI